MRCGILVRQLNRIWWDWVKMYFLVWGKMPKVHLTPFVLTQRMPVEYSLQWLHEGRVCGHVDFMVLICHLCLQSTKCKRGF